MAQIEHNKESQTGYNVTKQADPLPEGDGDEKIYHTRYPGSSFVERDGNVIHFNGAGELRTTSLALQYELDKITDKAGSAIYSREPVITFEDKKPVMDIQEKAANVVAQLHASQQAAANGQRSN